MSLAGTFETLPITEVLGLLAGGKKSGALKLITDDMRAIVFMRDGRCCAAESDQHRGPVDGTNALEARVVDVCFEVARHSEGTFEFEQGSEPSFDTPDTVEVGGIVAQLEEMLEQWTSIKEVIPSLDHRPRLNATLEVDAIEFDHDRWKLVVLVDGRRTVTQIVQKLDASIIDVGRELAALVEAGAVQMSKTAKKTGFADVDLEEDEAPVEAPVVAGATTVGQIVPAVPYGPGVDDVDDGDEPSPGLAVSSDLAVSVTPEPSNEATDDVGGSDAETFDEVGEPDEVEQVDEVDEVDDVDEGDEDEDGDVAGPVDEPGLEEVLAELSPGGPDDGADEVDDRGDAQDVAAAVEALRERGELPEGVDADEVRDRGALLRLFSALRDS